MRRFRSGFVAAVGGAVAAMCLAGCDQLPILKFRNGTSSDVRIQIQSDQIGDYHVDQNHVAEVGRTARIIAGGIASGRFVIFTDRCAYTYLASREAMNAIAFRWGAVTPLELRADLKVYIGGVGTRTQPKGWPLAFVRKTCAKRLDS